MYNPHANFNFLLRRMLQCVVMAALLVCPTTMVGQETDTDGASDLLSPPTFGSSAADLPGDGLLQLTREALSNFGKNDSQDSADTDSDEGGQPTTTTTPTLISTPSGDSSASTTAKIASPMEPPKDWGSAASYQEAASLWKQADATPIQQSVVTYPMETAQFLNPGQTSYGGAASNFAPYGTVGDSAFVTTGGNGCGPCSWSRFDVLLWNIDGYATPALITRAPGNVVQNGAGALGGDGTQVLYGNEELGDDLRIGGRLRFGHWFSPDRRIGIQTEFFGLGGDSRSATFVGDGTNIYARPFFNTNPAVDAEDAQVFAMPGLAEGSVRFSTSSEIWSAGPSLRFNLCCNDDQCSAPIRRVDFLLGYRFFRLEESFASQETLRPTGAAFADGTTYELNDRIRTRNDFHGVEIGVNRLSRRGPWSWDLSALCALGEVERVVDLNGTTRILVPGVSDDTFPGAFHVGPRDIGRFRDNDFAAIPQVRANLSYCIGCNWRLSVGYNFMYLSSAFRPGQFLNTTFDGARLGQQVAVDSATRPTFRRDDLFLHGANVGMTYNF